MFNFISLVIHIVSNTKIDIYDSTIVFEFKTDL